MAQTQYFEADNPLVHPLQLYAFSTKHSLIFEQFNYFKIRILKYHETGRFIHTLTVSTQNATVPARAKPIA